MSDTEFLYRRVAGELGELLRSGAFAAGARLPSLRAIAARYGVSLATAMQAYEALEREGLIEARERSGYFVRPPVCGVECEPDMSQPAQTPGEVTVARLALDILEEVRRPGVLNLGAAVPGVEQLPLRPLLREMNSVVREIPAILGRYEVPAGNPELREQIARHLLRAGCRYRPDEIIVTNGCMEAITLSLRAVAKSGDTIAIESPTFYGILQAIEALGMRALELPTHPRDGLDLDALEAALTTQRIAAILLVPSFNNPLGSMMPLANRQQLAKLVARFDVPLIEDDIYGDLGYQSPRLPAVKSFDRSGNVLLCSSFSKTLAPGYRIGYVVAGKHHGRVEHLKLLGNVATAGLPQLTIARYLKSNRYETMIRSAARTYAQRSEHLRRLILEHFPEGTRVTQPQGGFVLWVELPEHIDAVQLHEAALRQGIAITPGVIFSPRGDYRHHIRMSCGQVEGETMRSGVVRLGEIAHRV
ncbi:MAG TPA: PLP-dependent aminotransferase family protein [Gammaproteobacteria bacterium]